MKTLEKIALSGLKIDESLNCRVDYGDIEQLAEFIKENGIPGNLEAYERKDGTLVLTDGYRRSRALRLLGKLDIEVPVIVSPERPDQAKESLYTQVTANSGKRFEVWELAEVFRRLSLSGDSNREIARRTGYSEGYVGQIMNLAYCPDVIEAVKVGEISGASAIKAVKTAKEGATESEMIQAAKDKPAKKVPGNVESILMRVYQETGKEWVNTMLEVLAGNMAVEVLIQEIKSEGK